jgi:hypothetical protein
MKRTYLIPLVLLFCTQLAYGQWGVSFHQSNLPFLGVNYDFTERITADLRVGTDLEFEDFSPELVGTYDYLGNLNYELYGGLGVRLNFISGVVLPVGIRIFPFENKSFGFHIEVAPILAFETDSYFRGSWGIRYRFMKKTASGL